MDWYRVGVDREPDEMELLLIRGISARGVVWFAISEFNDGKYFVPNEGGNYYDEPTHYCYIDKPETSHVQP